MGGEIMEEARLQMMVDRMEIIDVFNRYAAGIDQRNKEIYRSCFTEELEVDITGQGASRLTAEGWVDQAFMLVSGYETTQHIITNHRINIKGDEAEAVAYLQAQHGNPENLFTVGGYYTNRLVRTPTGWRISSLKLTMSWTRTS
jgi:hypothetical protein